MSVQEPKRVRYVVITPARNEARYIERTLRSMAAQTVLPARWIVVDDGSTDGTGALVQQYARVNDWIHLVSVTSQSEARSGGSKVVRAFNTGYNVIKDESYDFIVKLDADLTLPPTYFEEVARCFSENPKVGLCGGYCVIERNGGQVPESVTTDHVRGAFKAYRRQSFEAIGGLHEIWSWDGLDEAALAWKGWELKVLPLAVVHHRPTSNEYNMFWHSWRTGREMYRERVDILSLMIIAAVSVFRVPLLLGSVLFIAGYTVSRIRNEKFVVNQDLAEYIRQDRFAKVRQKVKRVLGLPGISIGKTLRGYDDKRK
jgi:glycosyltransferase involved in cell wall biosynthesis